MDKKDYVSRGTYKWPRQYYSEIIDNKITINDVPKEYWKMVKIYLERYHERRKRNINGSNRKQQNTGGRYTESLF